MHHAIFPSSGVTGHETLMSPGVDPRPTTSRHRHRYRVLAVDYDGTLTRGAVPRAEVLAEISNLRAASIKVILVTGRILAELRNSFAEVDQYFDAIVGENGAVISSPEGDRRLVNPVPQVLEDALVRRGIPVRRGQVLLACDAAYDTVVLQEIHRLGLECQVLYNRAALMVLPSGVSKATGLKEVLSLLALSAHSTVAIGDAENDHALLSMCAVGIAVANAVPSLQENADLITVAEDGEGVREVVTGPIFSGDISITPQRWQVELGVDQDLQPMHLMGASTNVLIIGGSNSGKSHVGGMCAERLMQLGYCTLIIDYEGDHTGLGSLPGVWLLGGARALPDPSELAPLLRYRCGSMVIDLSLLYPKDQDHYLASLAEVVAALRAEVGVPHWIVTDEAHRSFGTESSAMSVIGGKGHCLISWSPAEIQPNTLSEIDLVIALPTSPNSEARNDDHRKLHDFFESWLHSGKESVIHKLDQTPSGHGLVVSRQGSGARIVKLNPRQTNHVRHWHKYTKSLLPEEKRFRFLMPGNIDSGLLAANVYEFHHMLRKVPSDVVVHHCRHHDFSRWARLALQDDVLGRRFGVTERLSEVSLGGHDVGERLRLLLLADIEQRYLSDPR
jgi:hydroxymethylpyrimidine pyrophosphatase-like HAD family hydrolase